APTQGGCSQPRPAGRDDPGERRRADKLACSTPRSPCCNRVRPPDRWESPPPLTWYQTAREARTASCTPAGTVADSALLSWVIGVSFPGAAIPAQRALASLFRGIAGGSAGLIVTSNRRDA